MKISLIILVFPIRSATSFAVFFFQSPSFCLDFKLMAKCWLCMSAQFQTCSGRMKEKKKSFSPQPPIENGHLWLKYPFKIAISYSYVNVYQRQKSAGVSSVSQFVDPSEMSPLPLFQAFGDRQGAIPLEHWAVKQIGASHRFIIGLPHWLVGGWATPLKNMKVNWDDDSRYMGK